MVFLKLFKKLLVKKSPIDGLIPYRSVIKSHAGVVILTPLFTKDDSFTRQNYQQKTQKINTVALTYAGSDQREQLLQLPLVSEIIFYKTRIL